MANSVYQALSPPPSHESLGTRLLGFMRMVHQNSKWQAGEVNMIDLGYSSYALMVIKTSYKKHSVGKITTGACTKDS